MPERRECHDAVGRDERPRVREDDMTTAPQTPKTATIHPGSVIHCWDHLVITLRDEAGTQTGFLSLYAIAYSASLGAGHVALIDVSSSSNGPYAATLTDDVGLGRRQQNRLEAMGDHRMIDTGPPRLATFVREPYDPDGFGFRITSDGPEIRARWEATDAPFWVDGQGGGFSDHEDIWAMFVGARRATLTVGGVAVSGTPFDDDVWVPKLGRSLSSAHGAFAEVRVEPVNGRATGTAPG
jgi:hypothetical protein